MNTMHFLRILCLVALFGWVPGVMAIHPDDWLPEERPEVIDETTTLDSKKGEFVLSYTSDPEVVPLNDLHTWTLKITTKEGGTPVQGAIVKLYGDMPEHRHGMVTKPRISESSKPGQYTVQGMKFHMPGWWVMVFDVSSGNIRDGGMFNFIVGEEGASAECPCEDPTQCACPECKAKVKAETETETESEK